MKKNWIVLSGVVLGFALSLPQSAFSWGDMGHQIVGEVADQTVNPSTREFLRSVLGIEPLSVSAIWPDHVRDSSDFGHKDPDPAKRDEDSHDFGNFHFCEIATGYDYKTNPVRAAKDCHGAVVNAVELLKDTTGKYKREEKMLALRYMIHVMGDIHQPLHVGNGHDLGGNACQVAWKKTANGTATPMNLHSFWDDVLVQYLGESYADSAATPKRPAARYLGQYMENLKRRYPTWFTNQSKMDNSKGDVDQWLLESQALRENGLYPDDPSQMAGVPKGEEYKNRPYCDWFVDQNKGVKGPGSSIDKSKIPVLDKTYADRFAPLIETQMIKGGLRLAATLDQIADEVSKTRKNSTPIDDAAKDAILKSVQDALRNK